MSRFLLLNFEDFGLNQDITKTIQSHTLFCICCLERNVSFINLQTCTHSEYLNNFAKPKLKPINKVICYQCHDMLKKIEQFKQQVEDSFRLLLTQANIAETASQRQSKLTVHKIVDILVPPRDTEPCDEQTDSGVQQFIKNYSDKTKSTESNNENVHSESEPNTENTNVEKEPEFESVNVKIEPMYETVTTEIEIDFETQLPDAEPKIELMNTDQQPKSSKNEEEKLKNEKKLKNMQEAFKIINNNQNNQCLNFVADSIKSIVGSDLSSITKAIFNGDTNSQKPEDPVIVKVEGNTAEEKTSDDRVEIKYITLTKEELLQERALIAQSEDYLKFPYRCDRCLVGFHYSENFYDHMERKHYAKLGSLTCELCLQVLHPPSVYTAHTYRHYTRYQCLACGKRYSLYDEAVEHYKEEHTDNIKQKRPRLQFPRPPRQTKAKPAKKRIKQRTGTKHRCLECNKVFRQPESLARHLRSHSCGEASNRHVCGHCGLKYKYRVHLLRHMKVHDDMKQEDTQN